MEHRITKCSYGGFNVEFGIPCSGGVRIGFAGVTMPAFIVYESSHFDTEKEAKKFVKKKEEKRKF